MSTDSMSNVTMATSNITIATQADLNHKTTTLNSTDIYVNRTDYTSPWQHQDKGYELGTSVIVAIALGSAAFIIVVVIVIVCFVRKRLRKKKNRSWVDNLTLSYIADSNIDLTKDNFDEMISLDNDNFLNSLVDGQSFSVYSSGNPTRQYTYSYF